MVAAGTDDPGETEVKIWEAIQFGEDCEGNVMGGEFKEHGVK